MKRLSFILGFLVALPALGEGQTRTMASSIAASSAGLGLSARFGSNSTVSALSTVEACAISGGTDGSAVAVGVCRLKIEENLSVARDTSDTALSRTNALQEEAPPETAVIAAEANMCAVKMEDVSNRLQRLNDINCIPKATVLDPLNAGNLQNIADALNSSVTIPESLEARLSRSGGFTNVSALGGVAGKPNDIIVTANGRFNRGNTSLTNITQGSMRLTAVPVSPNPTLVTGLPSIQSLIMDLKLPADQLNDYCQCLEPDIRFNNKNFERDRRNHIKALGNNIRSNLGKNIKNAFSMNLEEHGFYAATTPAVFGANGDAKAAQLQCGNASTFTSAIEAKCGRISGEKKNRLDLFLGAYQSSQGSFEERLNKMKNDIMIASYNGQSMSRAELERRRKSSTEIIPEVQFFNKMLSDLMSKPELKAMLKIKMDEQPNVSPASVLISMTQQMLNSTNEEEKALNIQRFKDSFLSSEVVGSKSEKMLKDFTDDFYKSFSTSMNYAMRMNPTISILLNDRDLFDLAKDQYNGGMPIVNFLESNSSLIANHFEAKCDELTENLTDLVCSTDDELVTSLNSHELLGLSKDEASPNMTRMLACEQKNSEVTKNDIRNPMLTRDGTTGLGQQSAYMYSLKGESDPVVGALFSDSFKQIAEVSSRVRPDYVRSMSGSNLAINQARDLFASNSPAAVAAAAPVSSSQNSSFSRAPASLDRMSDAQDMMSPNYLVPSQAAINPSGSDNTAVANRDLRSEVRDILSHSNKDTVERLVSNTDDQSLRELVRLREEAARNKDKLLELTSENERLKLKDLEDKIKALEDKKRKLETESVASAPEATSEASVASNGSRTFSRDSLQDAVRDVALPGSTIADVGGSNSGSGDRAVASASSSGRGGVVGGGQGALAIAQSVTGSGSTDPVILLSSISRAAGQEIQSRELSQEVISYLSKTDADIGTLEKIKNSGMVYKYKVMENGQLIEKELVVNYASLTEEARRLLDQKIASKSASSLPQLASLEVELQDARRTYSYSALKIILGEQLKR